MSGQVDNVLYHHKFTPWKITDGKCIVADQCDWLELDSLSKKATISGEKIRICVDADICQEWEGDIHLSDGEIAGVECAGGAMMKIDIGKIRQRLFAIIDETPNLTWMMWTNHPKKINKIWPKYDNYYQPGPDNVRMEFGNVEILSNPITYEKYIKDGKVAILYSPGFGAGWWTWNNKHQGLIFDKEIVQAVLDYNRTLAAEIAERKYPDVYTGGAEDLKVKWLDEGTEFQIREYDGSEDIVLASEQEYLRA